MASYEKQSDTAVGFRRSHDYVVRGNRDVAHILGRQNGFVLFNVEGADGSRFKHRYLTDAAFEARWLFA